jgi:hypothetical protein
MPRNLKITLVILGAWAALIVLSLPGTRERLARLARPGEEQRAIREVTRPPIATPSDTKVKTPIFWATATGDALAAVEVELPLSSDPVVRAKQVTEALILRPPTEAQRTLPADAVLAEFYLLPDGTGIADFNGTLASSMPSGILSEQLAADSITRTLAANLPQLTRVRILIQGAEADTVAGHVDLTGYFVVRMRPAAAPAATQAPEPKREGKVRAGRM